MAKLKAWPSASQIGDTLVRICWQLPSSHVVVEVTGGPHDKSEADWDEVLPKFDDGFSGSEPDID